MVSIHKIAHTVLKITQWVWLICVIPVVLGLFQSVALTSANDFPTTFSKSILGWLFLPGLHRTLIVSLLGLLVGVTLSAWILILVEAQNKSSLVTEPDKRKERRSKLIFETNTCFVQRKGLDAFVLKVLWSPDRKYLASVGSEGIVQIWDGKSFSLVKQLYPEGEPVDWLLSLAWSPDSQLLIAAGEDKNSRIWNIATGTVQRTLQHPVNSILSLGWSSHGIGAVAENGWSAFLSPPIDGSWQQLSAGTSLLQRAVWSWHSDMLATASVDGKVTIQYNGVVVSETSLNPETQQVRALSWDEIDTHIAVGYSDGNVQIWEANQMTKLSEWDTGQQDLQALCWIQKEQYLVSGDSSGVIKIWRTPKGQIQQEFNAHNGSVTALAISPDAKFLCSAHEGGTLAVWKMHK